METYYIQENTVGTISFNYPWSITGTTPVSSSIVAYPTTGTFPSWISVNSDYLNLNVNAPAFGASNSYYFTMRSVILGENIDKYVTIIIYQCLASNWAKWSYLTNNLCDSWSSGYTLNSTSKTCAVTSAVSSQSPSSQTPSSPQTVNKNINRNVDIFFADIVQGLLAAVASLWMLNVVLFNLSSKSMWTLFNQYQLTMLLPFLRSYLSDDFFYFLTQLNIVNFNFSFFQNISWIKSMNNLFDYPQKDQVYTDNNYTSGSFFINWFSSFWGLAALILIHIVFIALYKMTKWNKEESKIKILDLIYINFHFSFYFRVLLQIYVFSLLLSANEIVFLPNFINHTLSYCIALWWFGFLLFLNVFVVLFYIKNRETISAHRMFKELY